MTEPIQVRRLSAVESCTHRRARCEHCGEFKLLPFGVKMGGEAEWIVCSGECVGGAAARVACGEQAPRDLVWEVGW